MTTSLKCIATVAAAAALSLTSFSSNAASVVQNDDAPTRTVKVWDLDLGKSADVQALYERVQQAANEVCRAEKQRYWRDTRRMAPLGWREQCVNDAVDAAVGEVGNRRLAALHTRDASPLL